MFNSELDKRGGDEIKMKHKKNEDYMTMLIGCGLGKAKKSISRQYSVNKKKRRKKIDYQSKHRSQVNHCHWQNNRKLKQNKIISFFISQQNFFRKKTLSTLFSKIQKTRRKF